MYDLGQYRTDSYETTTIRFLTIQFPTTLPRWIFSKNFYLKKVPVQRRPRLSLRTNKKTPPFKNISLFVSYTPIHLKFFKIV